ncbi:MAG: hypothetical protein GXP35_01060, partial [Actinobacteria bacterium]|nr:hypothetical protein [Actinomycetota bacterium]
DRSIQVEAEADFPEWYSERIKESLAEAANLSEEDCAARGLVICSADEAGAISDIFGPHPDGELTDVDAVGRALLAANDPAMAREAAKVGLLRSTWLTAAQNGRFDVASDIRLDPDTPVLAVTVYAQVTNNEVPFGIEPETYDSYTVIYSIASRFGFLTCLGCDDVEPQVDASTIVATLPERSTRFSEDGR